MVDFIYVSLHTQNVIQDLKYEITTITKKKKIKLNQIFDKYNPHTKLKSLIYSA